MFNYEQNKEQLEKYIKECREKIEHAIFQDEDLKDATNIKRTMVREGYVSSEASYEEALKAHRNHLIDIKIDHTLRVVRDITLTSQRLGLNVDFDNVLKTAALLHDIGRFEQATWSNTYADSSYKNRGIAGVNNHAEAGYHILFMNHEIQKFPIPLKLQYTIGQTVKYHQAQTLPIHLRGKFNQKFINQGISKVLTTTSIINDQERMLASMVAQLVKDVDMLDILYQNLSGEMVLTYDNLNYTVDGQTLEEIAAKFGIDKQEITEFNKLSSEDISSLEKIRVPLKNADLRNLTVPLDIQERFFKKEAMDLGELNTRKDWNFITGMWWRLGQFLGNISFTTTLMSVEESKLLDGIYAKYPEEYRFLVKPAFDFAKEELLRKPIENNQGNMYVEQPRTR